MSQFPTSYDTTVGSSIVTGKIKESINDIFIRGLMRNTNLDLITSLKIKPVFVTGSTPIESNIPAFAHPLLLKGLVGDHGDAYLVTDIRPYLRQGQNDGFKDVGSVNVRNATEFNFVKSRTVLQLAWLTGYESQIKNNLGFAGTVFASWISETLSKRFALDPKDQLTLFIISHFYYQSLFVEGDKMDENDIQKFAVHTIKASKAPSKVVLDIFDRIGKMSNIDDYCVNVKNILENVRLKDLNPGFLVTAVGNSWWGMNAQEILAVALEHPPTWIAIVYTSLVERTFKNAMIARVSERYAKNGAGTDFLREYSEIVHAFIDKSISTEQFDFKPFE